MNKSFFFTGSCLVIFLIIIFIIFISLKKNNKKDNNLEKKVTCGTDGCPIEKDQTELYKIYNSYNDKRIINNTLAINSTQNAIKNSIKGPSNIFIIRHAEDMNHEYPLDCNGILRSTYIPDLIGELNAKGFGIQGFITPISYNTIHKQQTILLTSWLMDIPIFMHGVVNDPEKSVTQIFNDPAFKGKNIIFCWKHECIQNLVQTILDIGVPVKGLKNYKFKNPEGNSLLPFWSHKNYVSIIHFDSDLNFNLMKQSLISCLPKQSDIIKYGKIQLCNTKKIEA